MLTAVVSRPVSPASRPPINARDFFELFELFELFEPFEPFDPFDPFGSDSDHEIPPTSPPQSRQH